MARINKGPEVSPVLAATLISLIIGGMVGYAIRYFQVGYFTTAPMPDSMAASRSGAGRGGAGPTPGGGGPPPGAAPAAAGVTVPPDLVTEPVFSILRDQAGNTKLPPQTRQQLTALADALQAAPNTPLRQQRQQQRQQR